MTELEYIEKIEELRQKGLCSTNPESARRYAAQLKAGSDLSLSAAAEEEPICAPGQAILELTDPKQLQKLDIWQGVTELSDRERAAVKLFLRIHGITPMTKKAALALRRTQEADEREPRAAQNAMPSRRPELRETVEDRRREEPPLSLYGLLSALQKTTKNRRSSVGTPTYTLLMQALLLNENFFWSSDSTERHLRRWGGNYYENSQVILANLHNYQRREEVKQAMRTALHKLEDETAGPELRLDVARACVSLEEEMERWKVFYDVGDYEYGRYEGSEAQLILQQLASMHKGTISHIYKGISEEDLIERIVHLFSLAIDASEGRFLPAPEPEERLKKLSAQERALTAVVSCGLPVERKLWKTEVLQPCLLNILNAAVLVPEKGSGRYDRLVLAEGMEQLPLTELNCEGMSETQRAQIWNLLGAILKSVQKRGMLTQADPQVMDRLRELFYCTDQSERRKILLEALVRYDWERIDDERDKTAIASMDRILGWIEREPREASKVLEAIIPGNGAERMARTALRSGCCLIQAELYENCAGRCLSLALKETGDQSYWAACAVHQAQQAMDQLIRLEAPVLAVQAALTLALGHTILSDEEAKLPWINIKRLMNGVSQVAGDLYQAEYMRLWGEDRLGSSQEQLIRQMTRICRNRLFGKTANLRRCLEDREMWNDLKHHIGTEQDWPASDRQWFCIQKKKGEPAAATLFHAGVCDGEGNAREKVQERILTALLSGCTVAIKTEEWETYRRIPLFPWMKRRGWITVKETLDGTGEDVQRFINDSGRLLYRQVMANIASGSRLVGWELLAKQMEELERFSYHLPQPKAEAVCSRLVNQGLSEYGVFGRDNGARLQALALQAEADRLQDKVEKGNDCDENI